MRFALDWKLLIVFLALLIAFCCIPLLQLGMLDRMPGDIGDARLNNYFLENVFRFASGDSVSLWHHTFFYPFPYVLGFSDNLFGSAPVYVLARFFGFEADTSYQIWFLFGYFANFWAAYYALRRLNGSVIGATIGALIFAFALPTSAHAGHAQLHYRFGLPLAIVFFVEFLDSKNLRYFLVTFAWTVWQLYAGVYIGFFTLLMLATMTLTFSGQAWLKHRSAIKSCFYEYFKSCPEQSKNQRLIFVSVLIFLFVLILLLFYPYLQVTHLYGAKRLWHEIASMLPRPQSYFLSDAYFLWPNTSAEIFSGIPMRHEHQMFIGIVPLSLALVGLFVGSRAKNGPTFILMTGMLGIIIVLTLYVGGYSLWYFMHKLPLASAIRAMTRLDQVILFPIAYLAAIAIDNFKLRYTWSTKAILILLLPLLIAESAKSPMLITSTKDSWRIRLSTLGAVVPKNLPDNSILFFAQRSELPYADELDAMWVSMKQNKVTLNGYSGLSPPNYDYEYGTDCAQIPKRVMSYLRFSNQSENNAAYRDLMNRIIPIGFNNCDTTWLESPPSIL